MVTRVEPLISVQRFVKQVQYLSLAQNSSAFIIVLTHVAMKPSVIGTERARGYTFPTSPIRRAADSITIIVILRDSRKGDIEPRIAQSCKTNKDTTAQLV